MSAELGHNGGPALDVDYPDADGFVAITRSVRAHHVVGFGQVVKGVDDDKPTYSRFEAWADLIMECRFKPGRVMNGGHEMELKRGQLLGAVSWLGARWNWSPKTVRHFLDRLEDAGMIEMGYGEQSPVVKSNKTSILVRDQTEISQGTTKGKHRGKQAQVLTICKYALYQLGFRSDGQTKGQGEGQTKGKQGANEGQHIEERKERKESTHTHRASTGSTFPEAVAAPTQMIDSDGTYYGISIELTPEKHASWRDRFHALSGTWPSPLMAADSFLSQEFSRQGIVDPKSREARIITYLDKRNTEAAALQAAVSTTAIVKPTPNRGYGGGSPSKPDWNALLDQTMGAKP